MNLWRLIFFYLLSTFLYARRLIFIQNLFRHGARYPAYPNHKDHSNITWSEGALIQLTPQGKSMHYQLGKILYKKYWKALFAGTVYQTKFDSSTIYVKSTDTNRTIESAQSQLFGLLQELQPLKNGQLSKEFNLPPFIGSQELILAEDVFEGAKFHPVAIHTERGANIENYTVNGQYKGDFLLKMASNFCPIVDKWKKENYQSQLALRIANHPKVIWAMSQLEKAVGLPVNYTNTFEYFDNFICLKALGKPYLPIYDEPEIRKYLELIYTTRLYLSFLHTYHQKRVIATDLLQATLRNFKRAIDGAGPKIVLYSAHDSTVAVLLGALNLTSTECITQKYLDDNHENDDGCIWQYPIFASSLILQLWQEDNNSYTVNAVYNGQKRQIPVCLGQIECPYLYFKDWAQSFAVKDSNRQCGVVLQYSANWAIVPYILGVISTLLVVWIIRKYKEKLGVTKNIYEQISLPEMSEIRSGTFI